MAGFGDGVKREPWVNGARCNRENCGSPAKGFMQTFRDVDRDTYAQIPHKCDDDLG